MLNPRPLPVTHRVKQLKEGAYTQEEADAAAGMGQYIPKAKPDIPSIAVGVDMASLKENGQPSEMQEEEEE